MADVDFYSDLDVAKNKSSIMFIQKQMMVTDYFQNDGLTFLLTEYH